MGEYARIRSTGSEVKIGTCEDCYYLRDDQRELVDYPFDAEDLATMRFRFPWPDEDGREPGDFENHGRGLRIDVVSQPEHDHGSVQFSATNGYLMSVPCPEGPDAPEGIHRNGYGGSWALEQQGWREGRLVGIGRCNGCGGKFRIDDGLQDEVAVELRSRADKQRPTNDAAWGGPDQLNLVADRLLAGYRVTVNA